jgi:hypothetical protein
VVESERTGVGGEDEHEALAGAPATDAYHPTTSRLAGLTVMPRGYHDAPVARAIG